MFEWRCPAKVVLAGARQRIPVQLESDTGLGWQQESATHYDALRQGHRAGPTLLLPGCINNLSNRRNDGARLGDVNGMAAVFHNDLLAPARSRKELSLQRSYEVYLVGLVAGEYHERPVSQRHALCLQCREVARNSHFFARDSTTLPRAASSWIKLRRTKAELTSSPENGSSSRTKSGL